MEKASEFFLKIEKYILFFVVGIFAIFVTPGFPSPFVIPKEIFLIAGASLIILFWIIRSVIKGSISFAIGKFDLGVILFGLVYLVAIFVKTPNKAEAFLYPGVATFTFASIIFYFLVNQFGKKTKESVLAALFASGIFLSLSILATEVGLFAKIPQLPAFLKTSDFDTLGGLLPCAIYLISTLSIGIILIFKDKDLVKRLFFSVASLVILFGLVVSIASLLPGKSQTPAFPDLNTSWQVAVETIKVSPIFGVGPANYLTAFNLYIPLTYNQTNLWQVRFSTADDFYFTLITEVGFAGLIALVILLISIYKASLLEFKAKSWEIVPAILMLLVFALVPVSPFLLFPLFILLAVSSKSENKIVSVASEKAPTIVTTLPFLAAIIFVAFFGGKEVIAEHVFNQSLNAFANNDAKTTYTLMSQAIAENPQVDRYHISMAQVDMALATSLAGNKNLTDAERTTITQLIQAAINEGKAAVALNPSRSGNWEMLGQIYRSIMSFAQGADQFSVQAFTEAVALDPTNPNLRIELGGVYYALGNYDSAINSFNLAALAKPDLANAHYNLAIAYREKKDYTDAITEMNNVLSLVQKGTPDYTLAQTTLADLQKNIPAPAKTTATGQNLTTPAPVTTSIKPPITLPQEATPPASQ